MGGRVVAALNLKTGLNCKPGQFLENFAHPSMEKVIDASYNFQVPKIDKNYWF
jgi:hypothetical protein